MSVDNRGTTDVPRWYYGFMIRGVRYFGSIPEARTKAEALKVEAISVSRFTKGAMERIQG